MSSLKIGRGPKRMRTREERTAMRAGMTPMQARTAVKTASTPPREGPVSIFLDDERACPEGYTLARSPSAFRELVETVGEARVAHLALDWYLGVGVVNGQAVAEEIAARLRADPGAYPALKVVTLHSSDREKAIAMLRTIETATEGRDPSLPEIDVLVCSADETNHIRRYLG
jgi:hypothetical protein